MAQKCMNNVNADRALIAFAVGVCLSLASSLGLLWLGLFDENLSFTRVIALVLSDLGGGSIAIAALVFMYFDEESCGECCQSRPAETNV